VASFARDPRRAIGRPLARTLLPNFHVSPTSSPRRRRPLITTAVWLAVIVVAATSALTSRRPPATPDLGSPEWRLRESAIARARVFLDAPAPEPELPGIDDTVVCHYVPKPTSAMSPKFDCRLQSGEVVKVKYDTLEIQAETAATRLMRALGLAADEVSIVRRVRCHSCPPFPFHARRLFELFHAGPVLDRIVPERIARDFEWVSIERKFPARAFEIGELEGWHWGELSSVRRDLGGASLAELDALRLFAVLIGHWDNKLDNQRLICLEDDGKDSAEACERPALMIHDVGGTFGTKRVDLASWQAQPIWADGQSCRVSMDDMPLGPGTFVPVEIGEPGRRLLASKLTAFSKARMIDQFAGARFPDPRGGDTGDVTPWVRTLQAKIGEIDSRRCQ
jgi:hypothetical protein